MLQLFSLYCVVTCLAGASLTAELPPEPTEKARSGWVLVDDVQYFPPGPLALETAPPALQAAEAPAPIPAGYGAYSSPPQPQTPPALTSTEHLREAVRHLREAGFGEDADRIQRQADELKEMKRLELADKKKQIDELQAHVAQLELELGTASQYIVEFTLCELNLKKCRSMDLSWNSLLNGDTKISPQSHQATFISSGIFDGQKVSAAIETLESKGVLKVLSNPRICTFEDQAAAYISGEDVETIQQTAGGTSFVSRRPIGETLLATVTSLGDDLVRLNLTADFSRLGAQVDLTDGKQTPHIQSRSLQTRVELKSDQTMLLITTPQSESSDVVGFTVVKVSPIRPMSVRRDATETH